MRPGMLKSLVVGALLLAGTGMTHAGDFKTPKAVLDYIYGAYGPGSWPVRDEVFTPEVLDLIAQDAERHPGEIGNLDFDPFSESQDPQPNNVRYGAPREENGAVVITVSFFNAGAERETVLDYRLVEAADGWRVDDISSQGEFAWSLRDLLTAIDGY